MVKAPLMLVCMKNTALGGVLRQIQHLASPRAVLASRHTLLCCIFHTHMQWCFSYTLDTPKCRPSIHTSMGGALNGILYLTTVN